MNGGLLSKHWTIWPAVFCMTCLVPGPVFLYTCRFSLTVLEPTALRRAQLEALASKSLVTFVPSRSSLTSPCFNRAEDVGRLGQASPLQTAGGSAITASAEIPIAQSSARGSCRRYRGDGRTAAVPTVPVPASTAATLPLLTRAILLIGVAPLYLQTLQDQEQLAGLRYDRDARSMLVRISAYLTPMRTPGVLYSPLGTDVGLRVDGHEKLPSDGRVGAHRRS